MYSHWRSLATWQNIQSGLVWYDKARKEVRRISKECGRPTEVIAAVVSALSPGVEWSTNLRQAEELCLAKNPWQVETSTYGQQRTKALKILREETDNRERLLELLSQEKYQKTKKFFECLLEEDTEAVVIDRWMARAAGISSSVGIYGRRYMELANHVRNLAKDEGIRPYQEQAILWLTVKDATESKSQGTMPLPF